MTMRMKLMLSVPIIVVIVATALFFSKGSSIVDINDGKWTLVWSDEFEGKDGSAVDSKKWVYDVGGEGWGNNEEQYYTEGNANCKILNNELVIEARKETKDLNKYTSARIKTQGKFDFLYGKIEMRAKLPFGQGIWPAFWMLGSDISTANWPDCGEIDIMENIGKEPKIVHGTAHGPGYSGSMDIGNMSVLEKNVSDEYHTYSIEWTKDKIEWFMDGKKYHSLTPKNIFRNKWVYNKTFFLILNLAVGGNWPGFPDNTTQFPQTYHIDYVRVYQ